MPHTIILWLRHRLQEFGITWNSPRSGDLQEPPRHRIGIFVSSIYGIGGDHQWELLQKHQDAITPEYPHRPYVIVSGDLHCVLGARIEALSWIGSGVLQDSTGWRPSNREQDFIFYQWVQVFYLRLWWTDQGVASQRWVLWRRLLYWTGPMGQRECDGLKWNA